MASSDPGSTPRPRRSTRGFTLFEVLAAIARLLSDTDTRVRLRYAEDEAEAMEVIREHATRQAGSV